MMHGCAAEFVDFIEKIYLIFRNVSLFRNCKSAKSLHPTVQALYPPPCVGIFNPLLTKTI